MKMVDYEDLNDDFFEYKELEEISIVKNILLDVKLNGDEAVRKYKKRFDGISVEGFEISQEEIAEAYSKVDKKAIEALKKAADNIRLFAEEQFKSSKNISIELNGIKLGQRIIPIQRVGCYVPGGRYPLPSTALMCVTPAKVAGVKDIIVCSPKIAPMTIVAADIAGADRIFNIGGVQAIAAMTYGTESVPKVDKIVGPGNKYVTAAKKEVYGRVGVDFLAGPSEVLIIADESGDAKYIAADLLAQAEHDTDARADFITTSVKLAENVNKELESQLSELKTKEIARISLEKGRIIIVDNIQQATNIANKRAPEHLELFVKNDAIIEKLVNYGSLFIGKYSAEVYGDYCSGTNHTLPTNGAARYTGGLSAKDFVKILTFQKISKEKALKLTEIVSELANVEGLEAHKKAAEVRRD